MSCYRHCLELSVDCVGSVCWKSEDLTELEALSRPHLQNTLFSSGKVEVVVLAFGLGGAVQTVKYRNSCELSHIIQLRGEIIECQVWVT